MPSNPDLLDLVASIVSAHVAHNAVTPEALPGVIHSVYIALSSLGTEPPPIEKPEPAVPIKKSVFPDYIVCLEDGKKLQTLKRHLNTSHGMTAEQYRARWSLPRDYPMVAPKYAARRSAVAKEIGLGRKPPAPELCMAAGSTTARTHRYRNHVLKVLAPASSSVSLAS